MLWNVELKSEKHHLLDFQTGAGALQAPLIVFGLSDCFSGAVAPAGIIQIVVGNERGLLK